MECENIINGNCWVAYFDILGFKKFVLKFDYPENPHCYGVFVEEFYNDMLECLSRYTCESRIFTAWFSDTFLLYTSDDSYESFVSIAYRATNVCAGLVMQHHPVRGALGTGRLFAEREKNIFVGSALIDAYEYGEKQNWISFVITPEAKNRFNDRAAGKNGDKKTPWTCCDYCIYDVPMKDENEKLYSERLWTAKIGKIPYVREVINQGANSKSLTDKHRVKYKNTLDFIDKCSDPSFSGMDT